MTSRMDKHHSNNSEVKSRYSRNEKLYEQLYTNKVYTEFSNVSNNVVDLTNLQNTDTINRREQYHKNRLLNNEDNSIKKSTFDYVNSRQDDIKEKNYNINDILDEARKNRKIEDDDEKQRRLKSIEYNILTDLSQEKLKEYKDSKKQLSKQEEENLEELIHTITSNSLRKKIDDELLGDLFPTQESDVTVLREMLDNMEDDVSINQEKSKDLEDTQEENKIDDSFYTRSMELSRDDFESDEEDLSFLDEKKMGIVPKILIGIFILVVICIIGYVVYNFI